MVKSDVHWDFVLKEALWLAEDYRKERARHIANAKKLSKAVEAHFKAKDQEVSKKAKNDLLRLKRTSAKIARDVRTFWLKVNKIITFKQKLEFDEIKQKAMDRHLEFLVNQTEKYAQNLAKSLQQGCEGEESSESEIEESSVDSESEREEQEEENEEDISVRKRVKRGEEKRKRVESRHQTKQEGDEDTDDSFAAEDESDDNESTLLEQEQEEARHGADYGDELAALQREGEMSVEELRAMYGYTEREGDEGEEDDDSNKDEEDEEEEKAQEIVKPSETRTTRSRVRKEAEKGEQIKEETAQRTVEADEDSDVSFAAEDESDDNESTLLEQEQEEARHGADYGDELAALQREGEMSVEELRAMYGYTEREGDEGEGEEGDDDAMDEEVPETSSNELEVADEMEGEKYQQEKGDEDTDDSFAAEDESDDNESTLLEQEQEEARHGADYGDELAALQREGEMSVEELRAMYGYTEREGDEGEEDDEAHEDAMEEEISETANNEPAAKHKMEEETRLEKGDEDTDDSFAAEDESDDNESTLLEQEQEEARRGADYGDELAALQREGEMSVEELRAMYGYTEREGDEGEGEEEVQGSEVEEDDAIDEEEETEEANKKVKSSSSSSSSLVQVSSSRSLLRKRKASRERDHKLRRENKKRVRAQRESSSSSKFLRPYILSNAVSLREYQSFGVQWLLSLHDRRLNGILADEMGLGKTLQTISLLAYLAVYRGIWGPHLVVVPTSCLVNWEAEIKRFCPAFKVLTYFGSAKERKTLRQGWSKLNAFHVCVTSYQIVVQDSSVFRRKRWYYLILDEAHNIKNFKSKRWQTMLNFNTHRRLLLTGTPLQNNLLELWSLMHFLMPHLFASRKEFAYWFHSPLSAAVEGGATSALGGAGGGGGNSKMNDVVLRLQSIIKPFILRRLKKDVATQLPGKFEHVVKCKMSKRQLHLYQEFMARVTAPSLSSSYLGMMNVLMQLRKICDHPDLLEPRAIQSPLIFARLLIALPSLIARDAAENERTRLCASLSLNTLWVEDLSLTEKTTLREADPVTLWGKHDDSSLCECAQTWRELREQERRSRYHTTSVVSQRRLTLAHGTLNDWRLREIARRLVLSMRDGNESEESGTVCVNERDVVAQRRLETLCLRLSPRRLVNDKPLFVSDTLSALALSYTQRVSVCEERYLPFVFVVPKLTACPAQLSHTHSQSVRELDGTHSRSVSPHTQTETALTLSDIRTRQHEHYAFSARLSLSFPHKRDVQYDSGKLQTLSLLLAALHKDKHRCLIFTQMSKMLDLLEAFLNLHNYKYLRLDGSTSVEQRQRLMDRFNTDERVFVFILSTRAGGLGINLTGADSVIFYDTDWNPAMDAQAQDRAHRIGQTREVHIYRLVCESSVEENILLKARQKRELDRMVIGSDGATTKERERERDGGEEAAEPSLFSAAGLKNVLGIASAAETETETATDTQTQAQSHPQSERESERERWTAMAAVEDEEDVQALRCLSMEVSAEEREFDEDAAPPTTDDLEDTQTDNTAATTCSSLATQTNGKIAKKNGAVVTFAEKERDKDREREKSEEEIAERDLSMLAAQASSSSSSASSFDALSALLKPIERFAVVFRSHCDPFQSPFFISEQEKLLSLSAEQENAQAELTLQEAERLQAEEEFRALSAGELITTDLSAESESLYALPVSRSEKESEELSRRNGKRTREESSSSSSSQGVLSRQREWYLVQRKQRATSRRLRRVTGQAWQLITDREREKLSYWFNVDSGECSLTTPKEVLQWERLQRAEKERYQALPEEVLLLILRCVTGRERRTVCQAVCKSWHAAAQSEVFWKRVLCRESLQERERDHERESDAEREGLRAQERKSDREHNVFVSIAEALIHCEAGDTLCLESGQYIEPALVIQKPLRILGGRERERGGERERETIVFLSQPLVIRAKMSTDQGLRAGVDAVLLSEVQFRSGACAGSENRIKSMCEIEGSRAMIHRCTFSGGAVDIDLIRAAHESVVLLDDCVLDGGSVAVSVENSTLFASFDQIQGSSQSVFRFAGQSSSVVCEDCSLSAAASATLVAADTQSSGTLAIGHCALSINAVRLSEAHAQGTVRIVAANSIVNGVE